MLQLLGQGSKESNYAITVTIKYIGFNFLKLIQTLFGDFI